LDSVEGLLQVIESSRDNSVKGIAIFKHSTRCSISTMAFSRLKKGWSHSKDELPFYYLDLLSCRPVSNEIEHLFGVKHESPQLIVIKDGKVIHHASHNNISADFSI